MADQPKLNATSNPSSGPETKTERKEKEKTESDSSRNHPVPPQSYIDQSNNEKDCKEWMEQVQCEVRIKGSRKRFDTYPNDK
ncbi:hypothetical protein NW762_013221 [Fusarium torreyae]|uniref:Uncharacterized protein n=1 Tax=Fusarium torreyae TaxID=1237075 RepID=A0A9W8RNP5_9HYPO|nr:hypothetical protein NW762_013221 [Fusarium torreyae]